MDTTPQPNSIDFIETLFTSFESRIQKIENVFVTSEFVNESSQALMNDFQHSMQEFRKERILLNSQLRETLAKGGSLRKIDYDILMDEIFLQLDRKEKEAEEQFYSYIEDQKAMVRFLRQGILEIKNVGQDDNHTKIASFKVEMEAILKTQQQRKEGAILKFLEFQGIHKKITDNFQQWLHHGVNLLYKDIKKVKNHFLEELV